MCYLHTVLRKILYCATPLLGRVEPCLAPPYLSQELSTDLVHLTQLHYDVSVDRSIDLRFMKPSWITMTTC